MKYLLLLSILLTPIFAEIKIFANEYKPPKVWTTNGVHNGILIEILKEIEKDLNASFSIETYPWARSYKMALNNKGGIIGISMNNERKKIFDYNKVPFFYDTMVLVVKKGKEFDFNNIEDLQGKKIGYCRGCSFGKKFEEAKKYFIPIETDDSREQRLTMVLHGKIDAALLGPGEYALKKICKDSKKLEFSQFTILKKPLVIDPNYIAFTKELQQKELLNQIDTLLQQKIDNGTIDKIIQKVMNNSI